MIEWECVALSCGLSIALSVAHRGGLVWYGTSINSICGKCRWHQSPVSLSSASLCAKHSGGHSAIVVNAGQRLGAAQKRIDGVG